MNNLRFNLKSKWWIQKRAAAVVLICLAGWLISLVLAPLPARADVAPPDFPPGTNPQPGSEITQVRMMSETVMLDVREGTAQASGTNCYNRSLPPETRPARAKVEAAFQMRNLGSAAERMAVRFPLSFWNDQSNGYNEFPEITDLKVEVDGQPVATTNTSVGDSLIPWATFDVVFPPGRDVQLKVFYTADGACADSFIAFRYVLETGAGWKDTIGRADLIVRLPYDVNAMNTSTFTGFSQTSPGATISGRELRWHYENLEPTRDNNLEVSLVWPNIWQQILAMQQDVQDHPNDGEAWGRLGKAYKEILYSHHAMREDAGGQELYQLSAAAYDKAVTLLPRDALWHAGFAELLLNYYYYTYPDRSDAEAIRGLDELNKSLALDPNTQKAQEVIEFIAWSQELDLFPGEIESGPRGYVFLTPTATAVPPTATPATTPEPTSTSIPLPTATALTQNVRSATPIPATANALAPAQTTVPPLSSEGGASPTPTNTPICGASLALPMMIALGAVLSRNAHSHSFLGRIRKRR